MKSFELKVRFPSGGPLIGGAATVPYGFHASHAQLPDGRPYIPATALRGALRESLEALLRGSGEHRACAGGDGIDPEHPAPDAGEAASADRICALGTDGAPCLACRVFGTRRPRIGDAERAFSGLVLGDALPIGEPRWTARPSVALSRTSRSAADKHLVFQRIPEAAGGEPLAFTARGRVTAAALERYLEAAARATMHLGASRSRGLARVELEVVWEAEAPPAREVALPRDTSADLRLRVTLTSPALVGASVVDANHRETRLEIPGATLRGAIGFALRALLEDADRDQATQDLLHPEHGARFGFLYPADAEPRATDRISGPLPITAATCKSEPRVHGVIDTLLDRLVLLHATSAADAERAAQRSTSRCARCPEPLRTAHGSRLTPRPAATRTVVRAAMDRARQSAQDGQLYSQVLLAPGVVLEGTIRGIPPQGRRRLAQALGSGIVSFGRGRSAGWGQACIEVEPAPKLRSITERAAAFDRALRDRLAAAELPSARVGRLVPVTLLSPLWPSGDDDDGERDLRDAIGAATCFLAARRFARDGAWDQRTGQMSTFQATAAGGVFVLELEQATWSDVVDRLDALEREGVGRRRDQGFGQVLCFDPHFLPGPPNG